MDIIKRSLWQDSFFDDFFRRSLSGWPNRSIEGNYVPPVNIYETNEEFHVDMAAPGMNKKDFKIELNNSTLNIQVDIPEEEGTFVQREFSYHSFVRSFYLPNTVEIDKVAAKYENGILSMIIPKKEEAKRKPVKTICIS
ncbi:Hsp20/alpha crystallin family protein [Flammeovirgaceae bacterium SG7u.111]|nr:Hsp20/alpha crystallin family protein [Flammeovirgaceae bacterium SG7u.132]WPO36369.1 Hsp20/alpha crystallin family protein [Flammeovirgaceae bacterium SG7u.111]